MPLLRQAVTLAVTLLRQAAPPTRLNEISSGMSPRVGSFHFFPFSQGQGRLTVTVLLDAMFHLATGMSVAEYDSLALDARPSFRTPGPHMRGASDQSSDEGDDEDLVRVVVSVVPTSKSWTG